MGILDQFFRLREPAWSGRVVTLGALAARCPASAETKETAAPALPSVPQNGTSPEEQPAAERTPRLRSSARCVRALASRSTRDEMWLTTPDHWSSRGDACCINLENHADSRRVKDYPGAYGARPHTRELMVA